MSGLYEQLFGALFISLLYIIYLQFIEKEKYTIKQIIPRYLILSAVIFIIHIFTYST